MSKIVTVLAATAFLGEIRKHMKDETGGDQKAQFFVNVAIPHGSKEKRKYQYLSCYVTPELNRLFESALSAQVKDEDDKAVHAFSSLLANVEIESPFFEHSDGFLNGSGILKSVTFS